jgi:hypothetical protein
MPDKELFEQLAHELKTQNNRATQDPLFCVFEKERIYGLDPSYTEGDGWEMVDGKKVYYVERKRFVNAHFTDAAARKFIEENRHRLVKPFIYVTSMYRCPEMIAIRKALMEDRVGGWKAGQRVRYTRDNEWAWRKDLEGTIVKLIFYTEPVGRKGIFWTTPDDVEHIGEGEKG